MLIIVQQDATQSSLSIILQVHSTCFGCQPHPSSGVHITVATALGPGHIISAATSLQRGHKWLCVASCWTITNIDQHCTEPWTQNIYLLFLGDFPLFRILQTYTNAHPASYSTCNDKPRHRSMAVGTWGLPLTFLSCRGQE